MGNTTREKVKTHTHIYIYIQNTKYKTNTIKTYTWGTVKTPYSSSAKKWTSSVLRWTLSFYSVLSSSHTYDHIQRWGYRFWGGPYRFAGFCAQTYPSLLKWSSHVLTVAHIKRTKWLNIQLAWWVLFALWPSFKYSIYVVWEPGPVRT